MEPTIIEAITARKVLDSRGNWAIEVDIKTKTGFGRCTAPSGASTGGHEVVSYPKAGIEKAILKVRKELSKELIGMDSKEQENIDRVLKETDGTEDFSNIGGNTAVAISLANSKAAASSYGIPLYQYLGGDMSCQIPYPLGNVIGGGAHAQNATDIQEFLVIPIGAKSAEEAVMTNSKVHKKVKEIISKQTPVTLGKGDEGAWAADLTDEKALGILDKAVKSVTEETGVKIRIGLDVAANELWDKKSNSYVYKKEKKKRSREEHIGHILDIIKDYSLYYVEDPLEEEDFEGYAEITKKADCLICGDDLYVTQANRLQKGINKKSSNAILIKPNQCGTLTDTQKTVTLAKNNSMVTVISHRSGESADDTISHLAVAFSSPIIKTGTVGGERIAKLNELIRISEYLGAKAKMANLSG